MNKRPNFGLSSTATAGSFALQNDFDNVRLASKPFDGYKTGVNTSKKPFDLRGGRMPSNTEYGQGAMGMASMEKNLMNDIQNLDWELQSINPGSKPTFQSETKLKPKLFMKKNGFNDTGETKATMGAADNNDWDLPFEKQSPSKAIKKKDPIASIVERSGEASEWHLEKLDSARQGNSKAVTKGSKHVMTRNDSKK